MKMSVLKVFSLNNILLKLLQNPCKHKYVTMFVHSERFNTKSKLSLLK